MRLTAIRAAALRLTSLLLVGLLLLLGVHWVTSSSSDSPSDSPGDSPSDSPSDSPGDSPSDSPGDSPSDSPSESPASATVICPADRDYCPYQYSPTGQGCTAADGDTCCLPGAKLTPDPESAIPNCLILGDSVSRGYGPYVASQLDGVCNVQNSPWAPGSGGWTSSGKARDCLDILLLSATSQPVHWDVIFFNNGLHNLGDDSAQAVDAYTDDLIYITDALLATGGEVRYGLTTPQMTVYNAGSTIVEALNAAASGVMAARNVPVVDLYQSVVDQCGPVPYTHCTLCSDDPEPCALHYTTGAYELIARNVSRAIAAALSD